jgi:hypothetical protein
MKKVKKTRKVTKKVTSKKAVKAKKTKAKAKKPTKKVTSKVTKKTVKKSTKKVPQKKKIIQKTPKVVVDDEPDYIPPKTYKIVGYCPRCDMFLSTKDFASKMIFVCVKCGLRKHKKYLKTESERKRKQQKAISKRQYLKEAASASKHAPAVDHHVSNLPDVSIMGDVKD